ncbi:MAG: PIN domain-containing protein [Deltaproteobacteria bacterium]|nr:PIN domain-containing protein [Deltaproteobacteria bacterium]
MIALDTNVLVRLLVMDDDEDQRLRARDRGEELLVTPTTLVEGVWVWLRRFKIPKEAVVTFIETMSEAEVVVFSEPVIVREALGAWKSGRGDFADYLIRAQAQAAGARVVATFDVQLHAEVGFTSLDRELR